MAPALTEPLLLTSIVLGVAGLVLLTQARVQARLLRRRIAAGAGAAVIDPATGLFATAATWQCLRAEANRAVRLERPLDVWIGAAPDAAGLDVLGRELAFDMPAGATGIRAGRRHLCIVSCAGDATPPAGLEELEWTSRRIAPADDAATRALAFVTEATGG